MQEPKILKTRKDTVGAASLEALQKDIETRSSIELQRSMQEDYIDNLIETVQKSSKQFEGNFFIVVLTKKERLMQNVLRNYFFSRHSCPTPDYDQSVFRYNSRAEELEYIWCIPDKETCLNLLENALIVHEDERNLLQHVLDFSDGSLFKLAQRFNNEQRFTPFLEQ